MLTTRNMEHVLSATPCIGNIYLNTRTGPFQGPLCHFQTDLPMCSKLKLGGGNSNIFYFHPEPWGRFFPNLTVAYFSNGWEKTHQLEKCSMRYWVSHLTSLIGPFL